MPELRKDPILGRWVIISQERENRPCIYEDTVLNTENVKDCPFCPSNEKCTPPEILSYKNSSADSWQVRVVSNKYPALKIECQSDCKKEGLYEFLDGVGAHEVIIETPEHIKHMADMDRGNLALVFKAFKDRIVDLRGDKRFKYILVFKNYKSLAGATLEHPHSQLIALPMIPIRVEQELEGAKKYYDKNNVCVFCDIMKQEQNAKKRVICQNDKFIAFVPFASRFPYETWILPKKHLGHFENTSDEDMEALSEIAGLHMRKLKKLLGEVPFNFMIHSSPLTEKENKYYHWHIEIFPNLSKAAGFEWGSGFYINYLPPEEAAEKLNKVTV